MRWTAVEQIAVRSVTAARGPLVSLCCMSARHFLGGAIVGAGLVYFLDPERGELRRERVRARFGRHRGRYGSRLGDIHGLEAANLRRHALPFDTRRAARLAGGVLAAYGMARRGKAGSLLRTLGLGLAAAGGRTAALAPMSRERRRTIDIQKTLYVDAPLEQATPRSSCENFPLFVSNVREVSDLGAGRSRWVVAGPAGEPVSWLAVLTSRSPTGCSPGAASRARCWKRGRHPVQPRRARHPNRLPLLL